MDENKEFKCERCNEITDEKGNVFFAFLLLLLVLGAGLFHHEKNICKDCAGFLNFIAFISLTLLLIILFVVMVVYSF